MSEITNKEQAVKVLHDLKEARREQGEQIAKNSEALADVSKALKALNEKQVRDATDFRDSDKGITRYINPTAKDGAAPVRFVGENVKGLGYLPGLLDDDQEHGEWHKALKDIVHRRNFVRMASKRGQSNLMDHVLRQHLEIAPAPIRRLFADSSGVGAEWIPDVTLPRLEETLKMMRRTEALFGVMPMADKEVKIPFLTTGLRPYIKGAPTADDPGQYTSSSLVTTNVSLTATGFAVRAQIDEDASEDSILATEPIFRQQLASAIVDGINDAIINGDTAATHFDTGIANWNIRGRWGASGLGGTSDHRRAWVGLRARADDVSNTTDQSAAKTYAGFLTALANLASPHGVAGSVACITSPEYYLATILGLTEVKTLDVYGPSAAVLTGEVARIAGKPIIVDEFVDDEYNASGLYDNSTKTKTGFLLVNRDRFFMGVRRGASIEMDKDITRGVVNMVATVRKLFFTVDGSAVKNVHWSYNL